MMYDYKYILAFTNITTTHEYQYNMTNVSFSTENIYTVRASI